MRLNLEKDKILSMKVSQIGLNPNEISELTGEEIESLNNGEEEDTGESRFYKLTEIDQLWAELCYRRFMTTISHFPSSVSVSDSLLVHSLVFTTILSLSDFLLLRLHQPRLIILQGISGTW